MPAEIVPVSDDEDIDELRQRYQAQKSKMAIRILKDAVKKGHSLRAPIIKFITEGKDRFREDLVNFWQNLALVSALIGAIAITILLTSPSRQDALSDSGKVLGSKDSEMMSQVFYGCFGLAALTEIGAVLIVTIALIHFNLMITEEDMVWFVMTWWWFVDDVCQIFVTIGCFALFTGCFVGSFIVGNNTTGIIVSCIGGVIMMIILVTWLCMVRIDKRREKESIERVREILFSRTKMQ